MESSVAGQSRMNVLLLMPWDKEVGGVQSVDGFPGYALDLRSPIVSQRRLFQQTLGLSMESVIGGPRTVRA